MEDTTKIQDAEVISEEPITPVITESEDVNTQSENSEDVILQNEVMEEAITREEYEKQMLKNPYVRAQIMYNNYINNSNRVFSGKEKRTLKRKFVRDAMKGRFDHLFDEEKIKKREERERKKFEKLNNA